MTGNELVKKQKIGLPRLHAAVEQQKKAVEQANPQEMSNRIAIMADCSGSMAWLAKQNDPTKPKIEYLKEALMSFVNGCDFKNTAIALEPFPLGERDEDIKINYTRVPLTCMQPYLMTSVMTLVANGGTPLALAMDYVLSQYSITRAIIISDGAADRSEPCLEHASNYKDSETPIDCVHIGEESHGERLLQQIAEITGGKFIKFTDVASFGRSFKYLTPGMYGMLTSGQVSAASLGAKEVK
jgi:Mg-chelatase subunit ChlD